MDAIHCQRCGHWPQFHVDERRAYFLTSCSHVVCESCAKLPKDVCPHCQSSCRMMELNGQMSQEAKMMFLDPMTLFKEAIQKPMKVFQFQREQQKDGIRMYGRLVNTMKALKGESNSLKAENHRLRQSNEELKKKLNQVQMKLSELEKSGRNSCNYSPMNETGSQQDPLANLFRDPMERPNAHVQPVHPQRNLMSPYSVARTPRGDSSQASSFLGRVGDRRPLVSPGLSTPTSSNCGYLGSQQSSFFSNGSQAKGFFTPSAGEMQAPATPRRTPDLINRLRNLKCKSNSGEAPSPRF